MLNEKSETPLYRQIYEAIRRLILSGEFHSGRRLPAPRLLAAQLAVSRMTVINAYDQLLAEGYLESRSGNLCCRMSAGRISQHYRDRTQRQ